jgi:hypothetical protein
MEENKTLRKTLIIAICLFLIDALFLNQGIIGAIALLFMVFWLIPKSIFLWLKKQSVKAQLYKCLIYFLMAISIFGANYLNNQLAKSRAKRIIVAVEKYKAVNHRYPKKLAMLAPEYIEAIPTAKYTLFANGFFYSNRDDYAFIGYVAMPPFGRRIYDFNKKKWGFID